MKKSKDRGTFTITQDKAFREKLELMKKKSLFVKEIIRNLEVERDRSNFILDCFKKALMLFPTTTAKGSSVEELREWPGLSTLKEAVEPTSQEQLEKLWESVEQAIINGDIDSEEHVIIDFEKNNFVCHGALYYFFDATIELTPVSLDPLKGLPQSLYLGENSHLRGAVYLWDKWDEDSLQGLLKVVDDDGKSYFVELKHFSMMNLTLMRDDNVRFALPVCETGDKASEATTAEGGTESGEALAQKEWVNSINPGMFILMNRPWQALFTTRF